MECCTWYPGERKQDEFAWDYLSEGGFGGLDLSSVCVMLNGMFVRRQTGGRCQGGWSCVAVNWVLVNTNTEVRNTFDQRSRVCMDC